jgi:hypothetical protein
LSEEMGLGKTLEVLALILSSIPKRQEEGHDLPQVHSAKGGATDNVRGHEDGLVGELYLYIHTHTYIHT